MAFYFQVDGLDELNAKMEKLGGEALHIAAEGLYEGAGVVADAVSSAVNGIATEKFKYAAGGKKRKPSPEEKALLTSAKKGVAKFRSNGTEVQTSVGMQNAGYGNINGKSKPGPQIANAINSGTSFMNKQPFVRKAAKSGGTKAINAMKARIEEAFDQIIGGKTE